MYKKVWQLAGPIILANITIPLLGAVDIAVVGHLPGPQYMAAVSIGATIFSVLYFGFVFLRMGTAGLVAISKGERNPDEGIAWLIRAICLALGIGALLLLLQKPLSQVCFYLINPPDNVLSLSQEYVDIRILAAPAALANFAFLGWMIGMQEVKKALVVQLILNIVNIILDIYFVLGLDFGVKGAAMATVISEYVGLLCAVIVVRKGIIHYFRQGKGRTLFSLKKLSNLCGINVNIFIRSVCLQVAFFYFTAKGAQFGSAILAVNAVLMNFQMFTAYALDGFAHAAEALTGEAIGKKSVSYFQRVLKASFIWAIIFALAFTFAYAILWYPIVHLLTNIEDIRELCKDYILWAILLPLVSVWSFHLDGIFTGATVTKPMRNGMVVSLALYIGLATIILPLMGNHGLWLAFFVFMLLRAVTLGLAWEQLIDKFKVIKS